MICEIINPSDPLTLITVDFNTAAVAVILLGAGQYGLKCDGNVTPLVVGWEKWMFENNIDLKEFIPKNRGKMADILDSVMLGKPEDRDTLDKELAAVPEADRAKWIKDRNDKLRTSLNDIEAQAHQLAKNLRKVK